MSHGRAARRALTRFVMAYIVRKDLHYCCVGGEIVFMDLRSDAYFMLKGQSARSFRTYLANPDIADDALDALLARGVLVEGELSDFARRHADVPVPLRSASELALDHQPAGFGVIVEVARLVYSARHGLRTRNIGELLEAHVGRCRRRPNQDDTTPDNIDIAAFTRAAGKYRSARRFVPVDHSCLLDSLALDRFLANRGLESRLVFGVNAEPFSAHAWLQVGDMALNETVSYARMHTPILVL